MNAEAQKIQDQIDKLVIKRDKLRGEYKVICGFCYYDQDAHAEHCAYKKGSSKDKAGLIAPDSCPLGIYVDEWIKDREGRYVNRMRLSEVDFLQLMVYNGRY